jgi:hypothetical protein
MPVALLLQATPAPAPQDGSSGAWGVVLPIVIIIGLVIAYFVMKRRRLEAYVAKNGFSGPSSSLPLTLRAPVTAWQAPPRISRCYAGTRNHFEVAFFQIQLGTGEAIITRCAVAVRREPFLLPRPSAIENLGATLDSVSSPGWLLASIEGALAEPVILECLLVVLTAAPA